MSSWRPKQLLLLLQLSGLLFPRWLRKGHHPVAGSLSVLAPVPVAGLDMFWISSWMSQGRLHFLLVLQQGQELFLFFKKTQHWFFSTLALPQMSTDSPLSLLVSMNMLHRNQSGTVNFDCFETEWDNVLRLGYTAQKLRIVSLPLGGNRPTEYITLFEGHLSDGIGGRMSVS